MRTPALIAFAIVLSGAPLAQAQPAPTASAGANAGATPYPNDGAYRAFHERAGIDRVTARLVELYKQDPRLKDIFAAADNERLQRLLTEQFCYLLDGPCHYTGEDMKKAHADMGVQTADFNALVEDLQKAMEAEHVPFSAQNKLLAKLAPMERVIVTR